MEKELILFWALIVMTAIVIHLSVALYRVARRRKAVRNTLDIIITITSIIHTAATIEANKLDDSRTKSILDGIQEEAEFIERAISSLRRLTKWPLYKDAYYIDTLYWLGKDWRPTPKEEADNR